MTSTQTEHEAQITEAGRESYGMQRYRCQCSCGALMGIYTSKTDALLDHHDHATLGIRGLR